MEIKDYTSSLKSHKVNLDFNLGDFVLRQAQNSANLEFLYENEIITYKQYQSVSKCNSLNSNELHQLEVTDKSSNGNVAYTLQKLNSCNKSICKKCMKRKMLSQASFFSKLIDSYQDSYSFHFVTPTVPNVPFDRLEDGFKQLSVVWKRFNQKVKWRDYVKKTEITFNDSSKTWNIHFHLIVATEGKNKKLNITKLRKQWTDSAKNQELFDSQYSGYSVDFQSVKSSGMMELTKYVNKEVFTYAYDTPNTRMRINDSHISEFWRVMFRKKVIIKKGLFDLNSERVLNKQVLKHNSKTKQVRYKVFNEFKEFKNPNFKILYLLSFRPDLSGVKRKVVNNGCKSTCWNTTPLKNYETQGKYVQSKFRKYNHTEHCWRSTMKFKGTPLFNSNVQSKKMNKVFSTISYLLREKKKYTFLIGSNAFKYNKVEKEDYHLKGLDPKFITVATLGNSLGQTLNVEPKANLLISDRLNKLTGEMESHRFQERIWNKDLKSSK